jgi:predicted dehydrogenase
VTQLRVAVSGSGMRSRSVWQPLVRANASLELVGVQDVSRESLDKAELDEHLAYVDLDEMLREARPDVLLVCPIHAAHAAAAFAGLEADCHVLVEKPLATGLPDACRLVDVAAERGRVLGVVQNWRTKTVGRRLREAIVRGDIGEVSHVFFRYLRDRELPHLPDYLFDEEDPLLFAMAIHHFDLLRYVLDEEIAVVDVHAARPAWSRYSDASVLQAWLETEGGVVMSYTATFSSRNAHLPLESLQVEGELGTLHNESAYFEPPLLLSRRNDPEPIDLTADETVRDSAGQYALADALVLENFVGAVLEGTPLISPASENLGTLAAILAAARSKAERRPFAPRELLDEARHQASEMLPS